MKKSIRSFIIFTAVITLSLSMLAGCGAESSNENQKDNIQGTTNLENVGSADTSTQEKTEEPTKEPVKEVVVGKSITTVEDGCTYYVAETDTTLEAGAEIPAPSVDDKYETTDYIYTYGYKKNEDGWRVKVKDKTKESYEELAYSIGGSELKYMNETFYECWKLYEAPSIPSGVVMMKSAFGECKITKAPAIPEGVTDLEFTFARCLNLVDVPTIPSTVTNMKSTFAGCTKLSEAPVIPEGVTNMKGTFAQCKKLTKAPSIPSTVTNMDSTFEGCIALVEAPVIPEGVTNMEYTFGDCYSLAEAPTIPSTVTNMCGTFHTCESLIKAPMIPEGVTDMKSTFAYCSNLTEVSTISSSVKSMKSTFFGCTSLTGTIEINANPNEYNFCFGDVNFTEQNLTLTGSSEKLEKLIATGKK